MTALRLGSLFDGIGVFPLAAVRCGIEPIWASEIEKAPISITKRHFPDMAHLGDVTKLDGRDLPPVHMRASAKERTETAFRNSFGLPTDPFPTLLAGGISPFAFWYEDDPAGGCVRFPTETECERLMGLPEGWTRYGADGEEILSSHRYRALGNAIALPCAEYIMAGIAEALTKGGANDGI